jgi:hypothetical protein
MQDFIDTLINGPARYTQVHHFSDGWTIVFVLGALLIEFGVVILVCRLVWLFVINMPTMLSWLLRRVGIANKTIDYTFLQLTFPADTTKSAYATEQLHILLRSLVRYGSLWERLAARKQPYSLELVASRDEGIRYVLRVPSYEAEIVHRTLISFLPGLKVREITDYLPDDATRLAVAELKLQSDYVLPLEVNKVLTEHDPIAYLTGQMRSLNLSETVVYQIVVAPVVTNTHRSLIRRIGRFKQRIALGKPVASELASEGKRTRRVILMTLLLPLYLLARGLKLIGQIIGAFMNNDLPEDWKSTTKPQAVPDPYEQKMSSTVKEKLDQHLFEVSIRIFVASSGDDVNSRLNALVASFGTFSSTTQALSARLGLFAPNRKKTITRLYERSLSPHLVSWPTIVSSSELSDLYHFPNTTLTKTEDLVKSRSRDLPAPLSMKHSKAQLDVIVGQNDFGGHMQPIGLTQQQRQKHVYVIGKTGTGKTTMLINAICQDMENGKGVAVLDPHGDMFKELLSRVPKHRLKDVVVFDPSDREYPVGLNILDPGIDFIDEDDKQEWITSAVLSVFAKLSEEGQWGPRMEHILRNTTLTALQTPQPNLFTMQRLLTDKSYQRAVAKGLKDPVLKQFWDKEFKLMGTMQLATATAPLTHRLGHFITSKMSRHILLQDKSTLRMTDIMNEGKILLVNLAKGDIGEDQSFFFGTILTSFIWMAAYQRTKIPEKQRRDFFVYVDEFQNFATPQFGDIMSEGRKFHISLTVSHQNIAQIEDKDLVKVVAGNAGTIICLKASPQDEEFILPHMRPEVEKGDIVNLAPYHFYMKVTGDEAEDAFSGQTIRPDNDGSETNAEKVIAASRAQFARSKAEVAKEIEELMGSVSDNKSKSVVVSKALSKPKVHKVLKDV